MTWGIIPDDQIWINLGGEKGGGLFKMILQNVNTPKPNSVHNTCVFSCFEADDELACGTGQVSIRGGIYQHNEEEVRYHFPQSFSICIYSRTYALKLYLTGDLA